MNQFKKGRIANCFFHFKKYSLSRNGLERGKGSRNNIEIKGGCFYPGARQPCISRHTLAISDSLPVSFRRKSIILTKLKHLVLSGHCKLSHSMIYAAKPHGIPNQIELRSIPKMDATFNSVFTSIHIPMHISQMS